MRPPCACGCVYVAHGDCAACSEDARALSLTRHAGKLREVATAFERNNKSAHYCQSLEAAIASLCNEARNHRHVASCLRRVKPLPTATPDKAKAPNGR